MIFATEPIFTSCPGMSAIVDLPHCLRAHFYVNLQAPTVSLKLHLRSFLQLFER